MDVDKEKAKVVMKAIEEDAESPSSAYSFTAFCAEHKLFHDTDKKRNGDVFINCPFHNDEDPSLGFSEHKRVFHCLGCDAGGGYLQFRFLYRTKVMGYDVGFYQMLNELLASDVALQQKVGFSTIYVKKRLKEDFTPVQKFKFKAQERVPSTFPELSTYMLSKHCTDEQKIYALLLMQSGIDAKDVYTYVFSDGGKRGTGASGAGAGASTAAGAYSYDLAELAKED